MNEQEIIDEATKSVAKAKHVLDVQHRNNLITQSYLGEISHESILNKALNELKPALTVLKKYRPTEYEEYKKLIPRLQEEINGLKPVELEPETEEIKVEVEKPIKKPRRRSVKK